MDGRQRWLCDDGVGSVLAAELGWPAGLYFHCAAHTTYHTYTTYIRVLPQPAIHPRSLSLSLTLTLSLHFHSLTCCWLVEHHRGCTSRGMLPVQAWLWFGLFYSTRLNGVHAPSVA